MTDKMVLMTTYKDGGTRVFKSNTYNLTIVTCNTLDGDKDIYVGNYDMSFDDSIMCGKKNANQR